MRIKSIILTWFRGAADPVPFDPDCKSVVVYGMNGSGKSSFVDAAEYVIRHGKIGHLSHEYSGSRQEKGIHNTHKPEGRKTEFRIKFQDDSELKTEIRQNGTSMSSGVEPAAMANWDYQRTILRQDEVANFIHDTKGGKYSTLLPLLGLHQMEVAAENLRQLSTVVESESSLIGVKIKLMHVDARRKEVFCADNVDQILKTIEGLHTEYCPDNVTTLDALSRCNELVTGLTTRIAQLTEEDRRYVALQDVAKADIKGSVDAIRAPSVDIAAVVEPMISEKLRVLQSTRVFVGKLEDEVEVNCPACGQLIATNAFQEHVEAESERLQEAIGVFNLRNVAVGALCDTLNSLRSNIKKPEAKSWRDEIATGTLAVNLAYLDEIDTEALRSSCNYEDLKAVEDKLVPLVATAANDSKDAPPDVQALSTAKEKAEVGKSVIAAKDQAAGVARAEALIAFIDSLEQGIREEIRLRSKKLIEDISSDIQTMWATLHPGEAIKDVRLYLPDADKAIDIYLKFHGVDLDSPRLTLSEGYRNSLGLCIFLAMAKREADNDRPLFLDDVVVSMDRNHRGMILDLLENEFSERQVLIFTHDREWYTELRHRLQGNNNWIFKALLPYETPDIGIRWSHKTTTFDDARAQLKERPDSAGNDVRKIMDVELAIIAERLQLRLPYLRSDKNDMRTAHKFMERLVADGKNCFQRRTDDGYESYTEAIAACEEADRLLVAWANRASHTKDLVRPEAISLIEACEKALEYFICYKCNPAKAVWFLEAGGPEWVQCQCGDIRWRYGKG